MANALFDYKLGKILLGFGLQGAGLVNLGTSNNKKYDQQFTYLFTYHGMIVSSLEVILTDQRLYFTFKEGKLSFNYDVAVELFIYKVMLALNSTDLFLLVKDAYLTTNLDDIVNIRNAAIAATVLKSLKNVEIKSNKYSVNYGMTNVNKDTFDITVTLLVDSTETNLVIRISKDGSIVIDHGGNNISYFDLDIANKLFAVKQIKAKYDQEITKILSYYMVAYNR
jgi:hypothetical protein